MQQQQQEQRRQAPPGSRTSQKLVGRLAEKYGVPPDALLACLRDTAFNPGKDKQGNPNPPFTDTELAAALILAEQHDLNPFAREIYVTRSKGRLLVVVPVDGWAKVVNRQEQYDGCEFDLTMDGQGAPESVTCRMFRKDRSKPIEVTEFFEECQRDTEPWRQWPRRMLRHKAFIQAARYAFSLSGIMDDDDAEGFLEMDQARPRITDRRQPQRALPEPTADLEAELLMSSLQQQQREPEPVPVQPIAESAPQVEAQAAPRQAAPPAAAPDPEHAKMWAEWTKIRPDLQPGELAEVKRAAGVETITPRTPFEALERALSAAHSILQQ